VIDSAINNLSRVRRPLFSSFLFQFANAALQWWQFRRRVRVCQPSAWQCRAGRQLAIRTFSRWTFDMLPPLKRKHHLLMLSVYYYYYLLITKGPTGHLQCYTKTQKYNKTQWHTMTPRKSVGPGSDLNKIQGWCWVRMRDNLLTVFLT